MKTYRYLSCVIIFVAFCVSLPVWAQETPQIHGVELHRWFKEIEPNRYASSRDYKRTIKFFRDQFRGVGGIRWHGEVNLPSVKYIYIQNRNRDRLWDGIHIYEIPGGKIRFFVLPHRSEKPKSDEASQQTTKPKAATEGIKTTDSGEGQP